jgi:1-acyl-sn-glycerol-3-phosphate acyltransferase
MKSYHNEVNKVRKSIRAFFEKTFLPFEIHGPDLSTLCGPKSGVFVVSTHRSHTDYFMMGLVMHERGVVNLRFAAGDNLTTMPFLGPRFQAWGAFTVERDSSLQRSYVRNLCDKVVGMLADGDSILVFPEGGRSYGGGMMEIKSGIIAAGILAQDRDPSRTIWYIPAAISYERPPELAFFPMVKAGKNLRKPTRNPFERLLGALLYFGGDMLPFALFLLLPRFGKRFGGAYLDYGSPVKLSDWVDLAATKDPGARDDFSAHRGSMQVLSKKISEALRSLYRILPVHVLAGIIIDRGATTIEQACAVCPEIITELRDTGRNCATVNALTPQQIVEQAIAVMKTLGALKVKNGLFIVRKAWMVRYFAAALS